jgi:hypothetical protein
MSDTKLFRSLTEVMRVLGTPRAAPKGKAKTRWNQVELADLTEVEGLLDWLENAGYARRDVELRGDRFVVRWR